MITDEMMQVGINAFWREARKPDVNSPYGFDVAIVVRGILEAGQMITDEMVRAGVDAFHRGVAYASWLEDNDDAIEMVVKAILQAGLSKQDLEPPTWEQLIYAGRGMQE